MINRSEDRLAVRRLWPLVLALAAGCSGPAEPVAFKGLQAPPVQNNPFKGPDDKGHTLFIYAVAYSPDGKLLASTGHDRTVKLWDAAGNARGAQRPDEERRVFARRLADRNRQL